jgi:hypothetical protein
VSTCGWASMCPGGPGRTRRPSCRPAGSAAGSRPARRPCRCAARCHQCTRPEHRVAPVVPQSHPNPRSELVGDRPRPAPRGAPVRDPGAGDGDRPGHQQRPGGRRVGTDARLCPPSPCAPRRPVRAA